MASIEAGTVIAEKYRVERRLSQGGMGSLWVARQLQLQRLVAVKLMEPDLAASAEGRSRFEREARAVALIQSPHVVQIHDYGVEHDTPYIVMELLDGEDFGRRLKRERVLSLPAVARIFGQIAKALRKAHEAGMVHLDLKPANIFLARDDEEDIVKVLDFGIAKMIDPGNATETTATGVVLGSVHYMSPEQARGRRGLDHRSDLWSLGVIAFRAITGELPFGGTQIGDVLVKVCADPIPRASSVLPGLAPEVDAFFMKALDRDPSARFQSAKELAAALAQLAWPNDPRPPMPSMTLEQAHEERPPAPIETGTLTGSPRVSDVQITLPLATGTSRLKRWAIPAFAVVGVVLVGLLGSAAVSTRSSKESTNAAAITASPPANEPAPPAPLAVSALPAVAAPPPTATPEPTPAVTPPTPSATAHAAATAAPSASATAAREKPASPPIVSTAARPKSSPPPAANPPPKKPNPALGF